MYAVLQGLGQNPFSDPKEANDARKNGTHLQRAVDFNAIFRLDYGYGISNSNNRGIVFGIGQYF